MSKKKPDRKSKQSRSGSKKKSGYPEAPTFDRRAMEGMMRQLIPSLVDSESEVDAAQQIMYEAFEATSSRRQLALARKALQISPNCADAYNLLAEHAPTLAERLDFYAQALAAGERALGKEGFDEYAGHFWGYLPTRPYMRALEGLAECLWQVGRREEAAEHCRQMLRLNPNDNQGIRYRLVAMLLDLELHDELRQILDTYQEDGSAEWAYTRALLAFRQEGDSTAARQALIAATKVNSHVPDYLANIKPMPRHSPEYITPGGEDEAVGYAAQFLTAWKDTPRAKAWLRQTLKLSPAAGRPNKRPPWNKIRLAFERLPQREETWEVDIRQTSANADRKSSSHWMAVALDTARQHPVHFDVFDDRPKDAEVWSFLLTAFAEPREDEPHRPAAIRVARKTWFRSFRSKLADIGVECRCNDALQQLDDWFQAAIPQLEKWQQTDTAEGPNEEDWSQIALIPQRTEEIWQAVVERLPVWVPNDGEPKRPWVSLVLDVGSEAILATSIEADGSPDDLLVKAVWQALSAPSVAMPHLPGRIQVASERQQTFLAANLEPLGVECVASSDLRKARCLVDEIAAQLGGPRQRQALIHSPAVMPALVGDLFEAAALFYRARPWRQVPGDTVIRVACERFDSGPWFAVIMGQSGIEQGLALYEDAQLLRTLLSGTLSEVESGRRTSAISVTYGEAYEVAPEDLDAAEEHGWPVAGPEAYPCVLRVNPGLALRTPLKWEIELLTSCLSAIPDFLRQDCGKAEIPLTISNEPAMLQLERLDDV